MNAGFRAGPTDLAIPAVFSSFAVGQELYDASRTARPRPCGSRPTASSVDRFFPQVQAETRGGDPRHVVLAGAHLDSVPAGPGINDDGSGTAWQLALAEQLAKRKFAPRNKVRFLWFGGEEDGLIGSLYYAAQIEIVEPRLGQVIERRGQCHLLHGCALRRHLAVDQKRLREACRLSHFRQLVAGEFMLAARDDITVASLLDRRFEQHIERNLPAERFAASSAIIQPPIAPGTVSAASGLRGGIASQPRSL